MRQKIEYKLTITNQLGGKLIKYRSTISAMVDETTFFKRIGCRVDVEQITSWI